MGEVGIHLEDVVVAVFKGPLESGHVCRAQTKFAASLYKVQPLRVLGLEFFDLLACAVRRAVVDDEDVILALNAQDGFRDF